MATKQSTVEFITGQIRDAGFIRYRKMFGEYALYCNEKVIGLVCDDTLYIKPTDAGRSYIGNVTEAPPYPGAHLYYLISLDNCEDPVWISELVRITAAALPVRTVKTKRLIHR